MISFIAVQAQSVHEYAGAFLNTLSPELKKEALYLLKDDERMNMNFVPIARKGPSFHDFNADQKQAAMELLRVSLSKTGYQKSMDIMALESVLKEIENDRFKWPDGRSGRDPLDYHICIFGDPFSGEYWGWRFEGHHLSLNFTLKDGLIRSATPSFWGSNPGYYEDNGVTKAALKMETELGFMLINLLDNDQMSVARFSEESPDEIITSNKREASPLSPRGIAVKNLSAVQKRAFDNLLHTYIKNYSENYSKKYLEELQSDELYFAWAGSLKPGGAHYYRIQGTRLLIEYANVQNNANHVHCTVRDLANDYGRDLLREHYESDH